MRLGPWVPLRFPGLGTGILSALAFSFTLAFDLVGFLVHLLLPFLPEAVDEVGVQASCPWGVGAGGPQPLLPWGAVEE